MTAKLIVAVVFVWAVCQVTDATAINSTILTSNITSDGCNITKQCWSNVVGCNPSVNSSCFFTSINVTSQGVVIELSGPNNGFVALGLNKNQSEISDVVFVCSKNNSNSFVFETATRNNTVLTPVNVTTVNTVQYLFNETQIQCTFSISTNLTINSTINSTTNFSLINTTTHFTIINGTTNEAKLENATTVHQFNTTLNLPNSTTDNNNTTATDNTTLISPANTTVKSLNITHEGCNSTKLCFPNTSCKPQDNSTCFFASSKRNSDQTYSFELSGPSSGYIGLALTRANQTYVFVCGKNSITGKCFLQVTAENNKTLVPFNMPVNNFQGVVYKNNMNESLIQCVFNAKTNFNPSFNVSDGNFTVAFYNGSTNGAQLDSPKTVINAISLDLANPNLWTVQTTATDNTTLISPANTTVKSLNITHEGCNSTKLCFPNTSCKPQDNSTCFFASSKRNSDQTYSFQLSGPSSGYIGLALTRANQTYVFVCGKNSITGKCFLQVTAENNKTLVPFNMPVNNFQGVVYKNNMNESLIQCVFNAKTNFNPSFNVSDGNFTVAFYNGSTNGAQLDSPKTVVNGISVDLANPSSLTANSASLASHWTHVLAVLFGTMILHFITSHSP